MKPVYILLALSLAGLAQTNKGSLTGTVFDPQGAVVPAATVTVTNLGTNEAIRLSTSETGSYSAPLLDPVSYRIAVEAPGFKKAIVENIKVNTADTATVNITLEAGQVTTEVTVVAEADAVNP